MRYHCLNVILKLMIQKYFISAVLFFQILFISTVAAVPLVQDHPPVTAITAGMGFSAVAMVDNPASLFWNPALIGTMNRMTLDFSMAAPVGDSPGSWSVFIANNMEGQPSRFGLGIVRRYSYYKDSGYRSFQIISPVAYKVGKSDLPFGVSFKFITERFDEQDSWVYGLGFDIGTVWSAPEGFRISLATQNVAGSDLRSFPSETWAGLSWGNFESRVIASAQIRVDRPFNNSALSRYFSYGATSRTTAELPDVQAGYMRRGDNFWITTGLHYRLESRSSYLEYAFIFVPDDSSNQTHYLTYGYAMKPTLRMPSRWDRGL